MANKAYLYINGTEYELEDQFETTSDEGFQKAEGQVRQMVRAGRGETQTFRVRHGLDVFELHVAGDNVVTAGLKLRVPRQPRVGRVR